LPVKNLREIIDALACGNLDHIFAGVQSPRLSCSGLVTRPEMPKIYRDISDRKQRRHHEKIAVSLAKPVGLVAARWTECLSRAVHKRTPE
jgi:hypothetical protein